MSTEYIPGFREEFRQILDSIDDKDLAARIEHHAGDQADGRWWQEVSDEHASEADLLNDYWQKKADDWYAYWANVYKEQPDMMGD